MEEDSSLFSGDGVWALKPKKEKFQEWKKNLLFFRRRGLGAKAEEGEICKVEEDSSLLTAAVILRAGGATGVYIILMILKKEH